MILCSSCGLAASKGRIATLPLERLEALAAESQEKLIAFLVEETGRSESSLRNALLGEKATRGKRRARVVDGDGPAGGTTSNAQLSTSNVQSPTPNAKGADPWKLDVERWTLKVQPAAGAPLSHAILAACDHDPALAARIAPYAALLRADTFARPLVILPDSLYVAPGSDRRSTGTHYTPRSLTEPIVQHTLEPLVYHGPAEGLPRDQWRLKTPREILALKICDLAMGSGAFLVGVCRYLSARLVEAWTEVERAHPEAFITSPEGDLSTGDPSEALIARLPDDERLHLAARAIADRCLYGVDINPMAVEMAKLSLWLITVDRERPFTFLDHALKCGDSLLGVSDARQLERFSLRPADDAQPLFDTANLWRHVQQAATLRRQLEATPSHTAAQLVEKARLHSDAETLLARLRAAADFLLAAELDSPGDRGWDTRRAIAASHMQAGWKKDIAEFQRLARAELRGRRPFHWPLEFPEVFDAGENGERPVGFDAFVGNPPFMGGQKITGELGTDYRDYLVAKIAGGQRGSADFCAYFFLRVHSLLNPTHGMAGLVAANTIAQGDSREVGLEQIAAAGALIPRAVPSRPWPGVAALEVAHIWFRRGSWAGEWMLDDRAVSGITPFLTEPGRASGKPFRLAENSGKSFQGSIALGMGFILTPEQAKTLIARNEHNRDVLFPYLNGEDLNSHPAQNPSRWIINFSDWPLDRSAEGSWLESNEKSRSGWLNAGRVPADFPNPVAADFPECLEIVERLVKPERATNPRKPRREFWWLYAERAVGLYSAISKSQRVLACPVFTKFLSFVWLPTGLVYMNKMYVFTLRTDASMRRLTASRLSRFPPT